MYGVHTWEYGRSNETSMARLVPATVVDPTEPQS
jgi:hypothetical protein